MHYLICFLLSAFEDILNIGRSIQNYIFYMLTILIKSLS